MITIILYCMNCQALFESVSPATYQSCPRCASESIRTATMERPDNYAAANLTCAHINTDAWKVNALGYLYCSICNEVKE